MPHIPNLGPEVGHPPGSGFIPAESIFGWSWLKGWSDENADPLVHLWLMGWVARWNEAAEAELAGTGVSTNTDVIVQQFLADLATQTWWKDNTAPWKAVQRLKYGTDVPRGEYTALVESTRDWVAQTARELGFVDEFGNLVGIDINGSEITAFIEDDLLINGTRVVNNLPVFDDGLAIVIAERYFTDERQFGEEFKEGTPALGPGQLKDTYNRIRNLAADNYISLEDEEIWDMVFRLKREEMTHQGVWDRIATQIGDTYSFLEGTNIMNRITGFSVSEDTGWGGGSSLKNHLKPVRQSIADTWELGLNEVNLGNLFGSGLAGKAEVEGTGLLRTDEEGEPTSFLTSLEARRWARSQDRWKETKAYGTGMSNNTSALLGLFGAR